MANPNNSNEKWYFTKEQLENTPSRKCGYDSHKELSYRQQAANFIQDMGQRLKVSQLCINTAIVYMHRFYVFHSFTHFPWHQMAAAALFLAAKVEEQPRKLEYVIRVANICRNPRDTNIDLTSERYITQSQDLVFNENVLLQTLGFDVAIDHPHTHVVRCCHLVRASKDLAQTSYFMASNSLHLTTMCIQYKPTVVACFCILVACKWSNWEIPLSNEKKEWYSYVDPTVTSELLQQLTEEFLVIFEACPSRLKEKIMAIADVPHTPAITSNSPFDSDPKKVNKEDGKESHAHRLSHESKSGSENDFHKHRSSSRAHESSSSSQQHREREYKERKERERLAHQKTMLTGQVKVLHGQHRPIESKLKPSRPLGNYQPHTRAEPRDILRETSRDSPFGLANKDCRDSIKDHGKDSTVRDSQIVHVDKDVQKREYLHKPNTQSDLNSFISHTNSRLNYSAEKQKIDSSGRSRMDISKVQSNKQDMLYRNDESKPYNKQEFDSKKHLNVSDNDKSSVYINKGVTVSSQKNKSPNTAQKSVSKQNISHNASKCQQQNGSSSYNPVIKIEENVKTEPITIKEEIVSSVIKRPSLFSPEASPPQKKIMKSPASVRKESDFGTSSTFHSPLTSPMSKRSRNYSSSSEPELRPVMKKIDQVEGFENLIRDNTIGINKIHHIPDIVTPLPESKKDDNDINISNVYANETKPPDINLSLSGDQSNLSTLVNGLETNPTLISSLLKETPSVSHISTTACAENNPLSQPSLPQLVQLECKEKEHRHHKSKKKNKEKHKRRDKDKSREDKERKKKHKDRDKHKEKYKEKLVSKPVTTEPIKIKIHKDKIQPLPESSTQVPGIGLKIKIPKDKIKTENIGELSQPSFGGIKIKIPKEKINSCSNSSDTNKKREREHSSPIDNPPNKVAKSSYRDMKQNGRHGFNKMAQTNHSETYLQGLPESMKYTNQSSTS